MNRQTSWIRRGLAAALVVAGLYILAALVLSFWPAPEFKLAFSPEQKAASGVSDEQIYPYDEQRFKMRDGTILFARHFSADPNTILLLIHGVTADSSLLNRSAGMIRDVSGAEVIALDLRGHGQSGGVTGDIDYIGQYEDDISDVVTQIRSAMPSSRIILAGHSMGGGILQRYAMKSSSPPIDGYLLFAPLLGNGSPTIRGAMEQSVPADAPVYMQIHLVRILGLVMLNSIGITQLNSLPTMLINPSLDLKVSNYSYRAMASTAPQEFVAGLSAINAPLLVIVGSNDEAFVASAFQPLVDSYTRGQLVVIEGETHNGITHNLQALDAVRQWLEEVPSGNGESAKDQK